MSDPRSEPRTGASADPWPNTTHDWASRVDGDHLDDVRVRAADLAPGGRTHLVLEVIAYADDEAAALGRRGRCRVTFHADGSVSVADDGRGTDTRRDAEGRVIRKPVMATRDLRFYDAGNAPALPDGHSRRGMSVVAALSEVLVHTNHRAGGAWSQTYVHGVPTTDLVEVASDGTTGTTIRFRPDASLVPGAPFGPGAPPRNDLALLTSWPHLHVAVAVGDHAEPDVIAAVPRPRPPG